MAGGRRAPHWRIRPLQPATPAARIPPRRRPSTATCSSSAAARPARPSPRCSPSSGRDVVAAREGAPSALSHRRVAAAGQRRRCSTGSACATRSSASACPSTASSSSRPTTTHRQFIEFADAWDKSMPYAWQVRRSELDEILFRNAAAQGRADLRRLPRARGRVRRRRRHGRRSSSTTARGAAGARASSSTPPAATPCSRTSSRCKQKNPKHNSSALFGHFTRRRAPAGQARRQHHDLLVRRTAGSGSSRWPTAPPASARSAGRTT